MHCLLSTRAALHCLLLLGCLLQFFVDGAATRGEGRGRGKGTGRQERVSPGHQHGPTRRTPPLKGAGEAKGRWSASYITGVCGSVSPSSESPRGLVALTASKEDVGSVA
ncbi:hypothetical protein DMC30DRAFT_386683 [Rhodotorula diobovata]|uniref:Secreted protein n=1 Tax=Rhodotorula diobovata TaxID=5288 RepID=A0A5C5G646_9BASI|nr:hypothetical protein DMC30DRAFT_386683 [Rhodotorula diobovata]